MPKKFIFIVQGEGRGHMTQAISLYKLITSHGHEVSKVFVGSSRRRDIPAFFYESIQADIELIASPNFVLDKDNKSIRIGPTFYQNIYKGGKYLKSVRRITNVIKATQPYAVINFYDLLGGLAAILQGGKFRFFSVAHQYLASHTDFPFPKNKPIRYINLNLEITGEFFHRRWVFQFLFMLSVKFLLPKGLVANGLHRSAYEITSIWKGRRQRTHL